MECRELMQGMRNAVNRQEQAPLAEDCLKVLTLKQELKDNPLSLHTAPPQRFFGATGISA